MRSGRHSAQSLALSVGLGLCAFTVRGQDYQRGPLYSGTRPEIGGAFSSGNLISLRESLAGEKASQARKQAFANQYYNLKAGPVNLTLRGLLGVEFNDNVNLSRNQPQSDIILEPGAGIQAVWPLSELNQLSLSLDVSYWKYLEHPEYDRWTIGQNSDSQFSWDFFVGDFRLTFYDRFAYRINPTQNGAVSGVADYGGLDNTLGANVTWDLNEAILTAGYGHYNFISSTARFDYQNRASDFGYARMALLPNEAVTTGVESTVGANNYEQKVLNNSVFFSAGPFVTWQMTKLISVFGRAGVMIYNFDSGGLVGNTPGFTQPYFGLGFSHQINAHVAHSLDAGRQFGLGIYSDYQDVFRVNYGITWKIVKDVGVATQFFYENANQPGFGLQEQYDRFGLAASANYQLLKRLTTGLVYQYIIKRSDSQVFDYTQNSVLINLTYRF